MTSISSRPIVFHRAIVRGRNLSYQKRSFAVSTWAMAKLDINSKVKLNSGYEIPILGYGKCSKDLEIVLNFKLNH